MNAPKKGPAIMPSGPAKIPTIRPIVEPQVPSLLPPDFFVNATGRMLSATETAIITTAVIMSTGIEILEQVENEPTNKPAHARGAPGKTGAKVPIKPTISKMPAIIVRNKSNLNVSSN